MFDNLTAEQMGWLWLIVPAAIATILLIVFMVRAKPTAVQQAQAPQPQPTPAPRPAVQAPAQPQVQAPPAPQPVVTSPPTPQAKQVRPFQLGGSALTLTSLVAGIIIALVVGFVSYALTGSTIEGNFPAHLYTGMKFSNYLLSIAIGMAAATLVFFPGQFTIEPGEIAFVSFLKMPLPLLNFGVGGGWLPPLLMSIKKEISKAAEMKLEKKQFTTQDGVVITADLALFWRKNDALLVQNIQGQSIESYLEAELIANTRAKVLEESAEVEDAFKEERLSLREVWELIKTITSFKTKLSSNVAGDIKDALNAEVGKSGLLVERVQIENILMPLNIEAAVEGIYEENIERTSLVREAINKADVVDELMKVFEKGGIKQADLDKDTLADYIDRMTDRALALEDKAKVSRINFGGKPPRGVLLTTPGGVS